MSQEPKNGKPGGLILSAQDGKLLDVATEIATSTPDEVREKCAKCGSYMIESKLRSGRKYKKCSNENCETNKKNSKENSKEKE